MQRTGAAEGDEREVPRVVAALHGDEPQRTGHVLVDDVQDPLGRPLDVEAEGVADLLHRRLRSLDVELHLAAEPPRRQVADAAVRTHARFAQIVTTEKAVRSGELAFKEDFRRILAADVALWAPIVKSLGLKLD